MLAWRRWSAHVQRLSKMYRDLLKDEGRKRKLDPYMSQRAAKRAFVASSPSPPSHPLLAWRGKPKTTSRTPEDDDFVMHDSDKARRILDTGTVFVYENFGIDYPPQDYRTFFEKNNLYYKIVNTGSGSWECVTARKFTLVLDTTVVGNDLRNAISAARRHALENAEECENEGYVIVQVGEAQAKKELCDKNGFYLLSKYLAGQHALDGGKFKWYDTELAWAKHRMVRPLRKRTEVVNVLRGKTVELCYDPPEQPNIPVFFYSNAYNTQKLKINRELLLQGNTKLHMQVDGENVLTLEKTVKASNEMLGVFAATDLPAESRVSMYFGKEVTETAGSGSVYKVGLERTFKHKATLESSKDTLPGTRYKADEMFDPKQTFYCEPDDAYSLAHFFNSSDFNESGFVENSGTENCKIGPEGIIELTRDVQAGEELLWPYGGDYYKK